MPLARIPHLEIESLADFDACIAAGRSLVGATVQSVDLSQRGEALKSAVVTDALFLGCQLSQASEDSLIARGALVFPALPRVEFNPYRAGLYTADELYDCLPDGYAHSFDARVYAWYTTQELPPAITASLAMSLHDHAISDALGDRVTEFATLRTIGIMGGHSLRRDDATYADTAHLAATLAAAGVLVVTGGGPGAMEAANLGAWFAGQDRALAAALEQLARVPSFRPDITAWANCALELVHNSVPGGRSLGVPTWFYGHEPPNVFATDIAKYFSNALREDILLKVCNTGIIYLPGAAGTVQEIFQTATRNYYATDPELIIPMVLVDPDHWTRLPAWKLLHALGAGRDMAAHIHLVDTAADAADVLLG